jgi:ParB-like chromosome segregation protein Spo0J
MPCIIKQNISDEDILALQIQAQAIRPETKPIEFARQLKRIQKARPGITLTQLASFINKSPQWVSQQLQLLHLSLVIRKAIERGEISLRNAYMLARLPTKLRGKYVKQAKIMATSEFKPLIAGIIKRYKEAVRQGKLDIFFTNDFQPQPHLRPLKEILLEAENQMEAHLVLTSTECKTAIEGWQAALKWVMHLDSKSVEEQERAAKLRTTQRWSKPEEHD